MKYPKLVPGKFCKTPIAVTIYEEGLTADGAPIEHFFDGLRCNYQDSAKTVLTAEKKLVQISGVALFSSDFCPDVPDISGGTVLVNGVQRRIFQGTKARNPDGTVNYVELRLI
ncbi:MAG: hypothetical protein U0M21_00650 [Emergencia sp.]|nr:hypothetical protein [Emergencia sp.]